MLFALLGDNRAFAIVACEPIDLPAAVVAPATCLPLARPEILRDLTRFGSLDARGIWHPNFATVSSWMETPARRECTRTRGAAPGGDGSATADCMDRMSTRVPVPGHRRPERRHEKRAVVGLPGAATRGDDPIVLELVAHPFGGPRESFRMELRVRKRGAARSSASRGRGKLVVPVRVFGGDGEVDGVHGAPVFLNGKLLGLAIQVRMEAARGRFRSSGVGRGCG